MANGNGNGNGGGGMGVGTKLVLGLGVLAAVTVGLIVWKPWEKYGSAPAASPKSAENIAYVDSTGKGWAGTTKNKFFVPLEPLMSAVPATAQKGHGYPLSGTTVDWTRDLGPIPMPGGVAPSVKHGATPAKPPPPAPGNPLGQVPPALPSAAAAVAAKALPAAASAAQSILGGGGGGGDAMSAATSALSGLAGGGGGDAISGLGDALGGL